MLTDAGEGRTRLTQRRSVPDGLSLTGRVFAALFLGGGPGHADDTPRKATTLSA